MGHTTGKLLSEGLESAERSVYPRDVFDAIPMGIAIVDSEGKILDSNLALREMLGYEPSTPLEIGLAELGQPRDFPGHRGPAPQTSRNGDRQFVWPCIRKDGRLAWCQVRVSPLPASGDSARTVITFEDITEREWVLDALEEKEKLLQAVIDHSHDGIFVGTPEGSVVMYSKAMETISGYTMEEANERGWMNIAVQDPVHWADITQVAKNALSGFCGITEVPIVRKSGEAAWVMVSMAPITAGGQRFILGIVADITKKKQQEEQLSHLATHDSLTGLPNRSVLEAEVARELFITPTLGPRSILMFADLDHFKTVNDTVGHAAGDEVMVALTQLVRSALRKDDLLVRIGGDEFGILMFEATIEFALMKANRLCEEMARHAFRVKDRTFHLGLSIGLAPIGGQPDAQVVLSQADEAMYRAKAHGRGRAELWQPRR